MLANIGQLFLCLSILIVLHELGHFLPARWFGIRVNKFYLFFDFLFPFGNLLNFSLFKKKIGDTEYGLGWFPFGGYVQIDGMMDETQDADSLNHPPQPHEFRSKPAWQRLIVMMGGVTVNFFLGLGISAMLLWVWGEKYLPPKDATFGIYADTTLQKLGFKDGDKILGLDGKEAESTRDLMLSIIFDSPKTIQIDRAGAKQDIPVTKEMVATFASNKAGFFDPLVPFVIDEVGATSQNAKADLHKGDKIIGVTGQLMPFAQPFRAYYATQADKTISALVLRGSDTLTVPLKVDKYGKLGIMTNINPDDYFKLKTKTYSIAQAIPAGAARGMDLLYKNVQGLGMIFSGKVKASESVGGFGTMAKAFGGSWDWGRFWGMTATISLILAFMNLLPIPMLDGGYVLFLLYEIIFRRKPNEKFMEYAQNVGFILILSLLVFSNGMDIYKGILSFLGK